MAAEVSTPVAVEPHSSIETVTNETRERAVTPEVRKKYGLLTPAEHDWLCDHESNGHALVAGFIHGQSVSVLIGDSGLGKSPLAYQLSLCVAAGMPFLGLAVQSGLVVYADHENSPADARSMRDNITQFLGLRSVPEQFLFWPETGEPFDIESVSRDLRPKLLIIDSLRSLDPNFEKSDNAGEGMKRLREAAHKHSVSILVIHHVKKPGPLGYSKLEDDVLMHWLKSASGHSAIINQSDTRIALALPGNSDAAMVMRWHRRTHGESGPIFLNRVLNDNGEPIGYRPMEGPELLFNAHQQAAFDKLPGEFRFQDAKKVYDRSDAPTKNWLDKCEAIGIVKRVGYGQYSKTWAKQ